MRVARLYGWIFAVAVLDAPVAAAQRGVHPPGHDANIELCRWVWEGQPEEVKRCLVARRDLVETIEGNPYAHPPEEANSTPCHGWGSSKWEYDAQGMRSGTSVQRCDKSRTEEAASLSFWFNYLHSALADAVMWDDEQQATGARRYLTRLQWCDSKYRTDDPTNYHDVLECAYLSEPRNENPLWYRYGPSRLELYSPERRFARRRAASPPQRSAPPSVDLDAIGGRGRGHRSLCYL